MVKKALSLILVFVISFSVLSVKPFNIHAQQLDAPLLGVNVQVTEVDTQLNSMVMPTINLGYAGSSSGTNVGSITGRMTCTVNSGGACTQWTAQNSSGNSSAGMSISLNLANLKLEQNGNWTFNKAYNYIFDYEFILDDYYVGYVTFSHGSTSKTMYVNGTSFHYSIRQTGTSELTFNIDDYELTKSYHGTWLFPIESFNIISSAFYNGLEQTGLNQYNDYLFPIFTLHTNDIVHSVYAGTSYTFIWKFYFQGVINNISNLNTYFSVSNGEFTKVSNTNTFLLDGVTTRFYTVEISNFTQGGNIDIQYKYSADRQYIPIYFNTPSFNKVSTDFALQFGLSNELLSNLDLIANGNNSSNESSADANMTNENLGSISDSLIQKEDNFKNEMNNSLQNVNSSFRISDFGSGFVKSSNWVRTQFENLTNNTPFQTLITFSLLVGLSMILLGRVYK